MDHDFLSPLCLGVDPFAVSDVDGAVTTLDSNRLKNPNREAMLIDEFRISKGEDSALLSNTIQLRLMYGSVPLTNGFIPVRSFMPTYLEYGNNGNVDANGADSTAVWHLARPLYVPPSVPISVEVLRKLPPGFPSAAGDTNRTFGFSIAARSMPAGMPVPKKIYVPWACATSVYTTAVPFTSSDADIGNPFDTVLNVDYFTGYNNADLSGATAANKWDPTFQATLSNGKVVARDPIPFTLMFPPNRPIVRSRAVLQPKEFMSVVLDLPAGATDADVNLLFTTVGMTGWRELNTPLGALP